MRKLVLVELSGKVTEDTEAYLVFQGNHLNKVSFRDYYGQGVRAYIVHVLTA